MADLAIPAERSIGHGGDKFAAIGARWAETMQLWGGLSAGDTILDIGCGPGRMAMAIGERLAWSTPLTGFDIIKADVDFAAARITSRHPSFQFRHFDLHSALYNPNGTLKVSEAEFPVEPGSVDFAFATSVFTHMFRQDVSHYLSQAARALRPGATLFTTWFLMTDSALASCQTGTSDFSFAHLRDDGTRIEVPRAPEDAVAYDLGDALIMLRDAGFIDTVFKPGAWSRTVPKAEIRHRQDVLIARRA
jgi:SAM-dependent methyltransferase